MDGLLVLLLYAALFLIIIRYAFGSYRSQGRGDRKLRRTGSTENIVKHVDPVCGMQVDISEGYGMMYRGQLYRFCHISCLDKFETDPNHYLAATNGAHIQGGKL